MSDIEEGSGTVVRLDSSVMTGCSGVTAPP